jgi:pyruvate-formate lyase-activating enzyme
MAGRAQSIVEASYCWYLWHSATVLCDGRVTCGLDDAFGRFCYGSVEENTLAELWNSGQAQTRRWQMIAGHLCVGCRLSEPISRVADRPVVVPDMPYPKRLILEATIVCNLRCKNGVCQSVYKSPEFARKQRYLSWDTYLRIINEVGPHIEELHFYNYGESFLHPRAVDMLEVAKQINPRLRICTSTNALMLARPGVALRIAPLIHSIVFTIAGVGREAYARYHGFDRLEQAMQGMRLLADAAGNIAPKPLLVWRYIVFNWNDSDQEIEQARSIAKSLGIEIVFLLSADPLEGLSTFRAPGGPGHAAIQDSVECYSGYETRLIRAEGFFDVERSTSAGLYCWTGQKAQMVFRSCDRELNLRLMSQHERPNVSIRTPWETLQGVVGKDRWSDNWLSVPKVSPEVVIEIGCDRTWQPSALGIGSDPRELGVAVSMDEWRDADCLPGR